MRKHQQLRSMKKNLLTLARMEANAVVANAALLRANAALLQANRTMFASVASLTEAGLIPPEVLKAEVARRSGSPAKES